MDTFVGRRGTRRPATTPARLEHGPPLLDLDDPQAADAELTGAKAANLARARRAEHPVLPGLVITTPAAATIARHGAIPGALKATLQQALAERGWTDRSLVARSSSTVEDAGESSMAGQFDSVLDLRGWDGLAEGIVAGGALRRAGRPRRQPHRRADPAVPAGRAGRRDVRRRSGAPRRRPHRGGVHRRRAPTRWSAAPSTATPPSSRPRASTSPAPTSTARPATAWPPWPAASTPTSAAPRTSSGPSTPTTSCTCCRPGPSPPPCTIRRGHGSGPVRWPRPSRCRSPRSSCDLWIGPLRDGLTEAVQVSGTVSAAALERSPVVTTVDGQRRRRPRPARRPSPSEGSRRLDPLPPTRRLMAAWRVGRLRASLPALATDLVREVDTDLAEVPPLDELHRSPAARRSSSAPPRPSPPCTATRCWPACCSTSRTSTSPARRSACARWPRAAAWVRATPRSWPAAPSCCRWCPRPSARPRRCPPRLPHRRSGPSPPPATRPTAPRARPAPSWASPPRCAVRPSPAKRSASGCGGCRSCTARAAWDLADELVERGQLRQQDDVRWLRRGELVQMVEGAGPPADLASRTAPPRRPCPLRSTCPRTARWSPTSAPRPRARAPAAAPDRVRCTSAPRPSRPRATCWWCAPSIPASPRCCRGWAAWWPRPAARSATWRSWLGSTGCPPSWAAPVPPTRFADGVVVEVDGDTGEVRVADAEPDPTEPDHEEEAA